MSAPNAHTDAHQAHHPKLQHHFHNMAQQLEASILGMWVFLVTEVMFFGPLFFIYFLYRPHLVAGLFGRMVVILRSRAGEYWYRQHIWRFSLCRVDRWRDRRHDRGLDQRFSDQYQWTVSWFGGYHPGRNIVPPRL